MDQSVILSACGLNLYYGENHALKDISIDIKANKITALIGPSGCGKSTFLRTIDRMNDLIPSVKITGSLTFHGQEIYAPGVDVTDLRRRIGMVFQKPNPFPMSIYDNVAYGPRTHGVRSKLALDELVEKSLRQAAIWDEVKDRLKKPALGLSGGQQQRLCIARALAVQAGGAADGRGHLRPGPHLYIQNRRPCHGAEKRVHYRHGDSQHAAGRPRLRPDRFLPAGRPGGVRGHGAALFHAPGQAHRGLHHREVWIMRVKFEAQLERLNVELITMGALCEEVISGAAKALLDGDSGLRETVLAAERDINQKERDIESLCMKLLLQQQPVARDLRTISSALKMISDMERIGDQAADIAEITRDIADNSIKDLVPIGDMARATIKMVTDSVDSFVRKDLGLAEAVISSDDVVDDLFLQVREELIRRIGMGDSGEVCIDLLMIAKYLERIGDHAVQHRRVGGVLPHRAPC